MRIEQATSGDAAAIAAIYAHHVLHGTATFETMPPGEAEMRVRLAKVLAACWPWLVARGEDGSVCGYAYAAQFRDRPAYRFACENSIYIAAERMGQGIGGTLLDALVGAARACGFRQMIAVIGGAEPASRALHARRGFEEVGRIRSVGFKHGRWLDTLYMQLPLVAPEAGATRAD
ncbi:GNAT family N-acetyltransferase [Parablastomonas sp. CN1-191]|uniref:GNAT family N-acetyltransferase n=1 Tax=Parablastomonas sp. CN1-191 TaxID=3400908 RepID=UPI003BF900B8